MVLVAAACSAPAALAPAALPKDPAPGTLGCHAVKNPTEPKLTAWDPDERARINALRQQGVVAVRYAVRGCNVELEVLPNCVGKGTYGFSAYAESRQDYVQNQDDLFAELPLGAASLSGKLSGNRQLRTDYLLVGVASLPSNAAYAKESLAGPDCARATHVVARVYLGGFVLAAGDERTLKAEASLFGAGAGAESSSKIERVWSGGVASACTKAQEEGKESPLCSVPLQIGLLPLGEAAAAPSAAAQAAASSSPQTASAGATAPASAQLATLRRYYSELNAHTFDAGRYFAPSVKRYISMQSTSPAAINRYMRGLFPKQYESYASSFDESTLREDGPNAVAFVERSRFYDVNAKESRAMTTAVHVEFDAGGQIVEFRIASVLSREATPAAK